MIKNKSFSINGRQISEEYPPYIIAELSANHNGSLDHALHIMDLAKEAGVDAVKIQTYTADTITINSNNSDFVIKKGPWKKKTLYELYKLAHTPWDWHDAIFEKGKELDIAVFSSPFDPTSVDFLEQFNPPAYKIASFELVDTPLIEYVASKKRPIIMSTGMANQYEIMDAVVSANQGGAENIALLHCTSGYPTPYNQADLKTINSLRSRFNLTIGLSDHTLESAVPVAATALGASIIEKHFTSSRSNLGADSNFSLEPKKVYVKKITLLKSNQRKTANFEIECSKGFYIRSFARDLAISLDTFGHIDSLKRTKVGLFSLNSAILLDDLLKIRQTLTEFNCIHSSVSMLDDILAYEIEDKEDLNNLSLGKSISINVNKLINPPLNSFDKNLLFLLKKGKVLSYGKLNGNLFEPIKILI